MEEQMACKQYFVVLHEGQWTVRFEDQPDDPYPTQSKAIRAAIDAAHLIGSRGEDAQVLVQIENLQFRTEWTYGQDVYPPED
jgi:hypothetical protein